MNIRTVLIGSLSLGINISACSGLAIATVLMAPIAHAAHFENLPMSPALMELSCLSGPLTPSIEIENTDSGGCEDAESCIQSTIRGELQRSSQATNISGEMQLLSPGINQLSSKLSLNPPLLIAMARDGPLFEENYAFTHQLRKIE